MHTAYRRLTIIAVDFGALSVKVSGNIGGFALGDVFLKDTQNQGLQAAWRSLPSGWQTEKHQRPRSKGNIHLVDDS
jgi:hypothetical protein